MELDRQQLHSVGTAVVVAGVIGVVCGLVAIIWPKIPLLTLAIVAGFYLLCAGALSIGRAIGGDREPVARALSAALGVIAVMIGVAIIRRPGNTVLVVALGVGLWLLAAGIVEAIRTLGTPGHRFAGFVIALVDVTLGTLILSWPKASVTTVAVLTGIAFVIRGVLMIFEGTQLRRVSSTSGRPESRSSGADEPPALPV